MKNGKTSAFITQSVLLKAFGHKYIRKIPKKSGKGFWYIYKETFKKPFQALAQIFGIKKATISENYKAQNIERDYGASQTTYAAHVLEYFTNREKWDALFAKEENRKKYKTPQKPKAKTGGARKPGTGKKRSGGGGREKKPSDDAIRVNRSLMYHVWKTYGSGAKSEERSRAMEGNDNARKDGAGNEATGASRPQTDEEMRREKEETEKARKEAGLPPVREDLGGRVSVIDDLSWNPNDENYRYKDTGYIAGARKEKALSQIRQAGKNRERLRETDIDWDAIEENGRAAKEVIVKSNIFGQVDWAALKEGGMTGGAAFLVDRVYAAIGKEPAEDSAEARRAYVIGVNGLRDILEQVKTVDDVKDALLEIHGEMRGYFLSVRESPEAKERHAPVIELAHASQEAHEKSSAKFNEYYDELRNAKVRVDKRVQAFLRENKVIKGNQRVDSTYIDQYKENLSPEKWNELVALKEQAEKEEGAKADELSQEYGKLKADYEAINEKAEKEREKYRQWVSQKEAAVALSNPLSRAWKQLGQKFIDITSVYNNKTFVRHMADARRGNYDDWAWAEKEKIEVSRKGEERKARFEFLVAQNYSRKGGRNISAKSTEELKKAFNLRDIQSGNWVLQDPESAKWHVDRCAEGFADLCDVTGIPDNLISLNGRLALAIGARGSGGARGHYEPVERVINITKMKGGGSLAHEWFHAFDNMIMEAMGGSIGGKNSFMTNKYFSLTKTQRELLDKYLNEQTGWLKEQYKKKCEAKGIKIPETPTEEHQIKVAAAFDELTKAMTEGNVRPIKTIEYSAISAQSAKANIRATSGGLGGEIYRAGSFEQAVEAINAVYGDVEKDSKQEKQRNLWVKAAAAHYLGAPKEGETKTVQVGLGKGISEYWDAALTLDSANTNSYWATTHEMAARAFSAYVDDKLRAQGRLNDYLANYTENKYYGAQKPYPEREERKRINAAFDKLFQTVAETKAIRKALVALVEADELTTQSILLKAFGHKYIRKVPKKSGKGFWYIYKETFKKPLQALAQIFGIKSSKIDADFKAQNIERDYGADKATYAAHVLEYFTNREKWDGIFAKEENRKKYKTPQKPKAKTEGGKKPKPKTGGSKPKAEGGKKTSESAIRVNRSLMYRVWATYNKGESKDEAKETPKQETAPQTTSKPQTDAEMRQEQEATRKAREEAGLPPVREDIGERVSCIDDVTQKGEKEDATARKEAALERIREAGKKKERLHETDIDWEAIEDGSGAAKEVITKANVFGQVDWSDLQSGKTKGGMKGGAAFLIDKVYEAIAEAPQEDTAEARRAYVNAINSLRNRLENTPAVQSGRDVQDVLEEIRGEMNGKIVWSEIEQEPEFKEMQEKIEDAWGEHQNATNAYRAARYTDEEEAAKRKVDDALEKIKRLEDERDDWIRQKREAAALSNPLSKTWRSLGEKFANIVNKDDMSFIEHSEDARRGEHDTWEWAEKYGVAPLKGEFPSHFVRYIAPSYERKGGRDITAKSTEEIRQMFNLRGIRYGDWVLKELSTAQWHVKRAAEGLADLADITGIPDKLISLNGRVALGIGAADQKGAYAHYMPSLREININKMDGGGSLAHEWFHAFDNLIMDAMGGEKGHYNYLMTNNYVNLDRQEAAALKKYLDAPEGSKEKSKAREKCEELKLKVPETLTEEHQIKVAQAFEELTKAMTEGDVEQSVHVFFGYDDRERAKKKIGAGQKGLGGAIYRAGSFDEATKTIYEQSKSDTERVKWLKLAAAHYYGKSKGWGTVEAKTGQKMTEFLSAAKATDAEYKKTYYATTHEMAARAFEAYVGDKLEEQNRRNDYLVRRRNDQRDVPQGEERKRINAAFDKLFRVIAETNAIRKALAAVAKRKRWLWVENGKIWVRKSVLDAWQQGMEEQRQRARQRRDRRKNGKSA